ncbi:hypothetical protein V5799_017334 [Amblyomma americanum]|uniref:Uncharacterized protein n=1 Tax=Amblyomma americanum TaxID=6943 RepID=A0AAQ4F3K4_AMBAM
MSESSTPNRHSSRKRLLVRLQMNRVIRFPRYLECTHQYRNLVRLLLEPVTTLRATMGVVVKHPWLFLFPDPTHILTREVDPRVTSPQLSGPLLVGNRQQEQAFVQCAPPPVDEQGVPLPTLDRKAAAENLRDQSAAASAPTGSGTFGHEPLFPADLSESFEEGSFEDDKVHHVHPVRRDSEEGLFEETSMTTTAFDDGQRHEDPSPPRKQPPLQNKKKPQSKKGQQNKDEVRAFFDSLKTLSTEHETTSQQVQGRGSRQGQSFSEGNTYPGQLADGGQDQFAGQQQAPYPGYYPADGDETVGLRLPPLGGDEGYTEAAPYGAGQFANVRASTDAGQGMMSPTSGYTSPDYGAYEPSTQQTTTSSIPGRRY